MSGIFYCGDNLEILTELQLVPDESVDLIYLDPPFNSRRTYNVTYKGSTAQEVAFKDYWSWEEAAPTFARLVDSSYVPPTLRAFLRALRDALVDDDSDLLAYISMMTPRLVELRRVLQQTGSLFLHCDPTASHYLKVILDTIFGADKFENEIIWQRTPSKGLSTKTLPNNHDVILSYRKGVERTWNSDAMFMPYDLNDLDEKTLEKYAATDKKGRRFQLTSLINPNPDRPNLTYEFLGVTRVWRWTKERMQAAYQAGLVVQAKPGGVPRYKRYLDEQRGKPLGDIWVDIPPNNSQSKDDTGYDTQKPLPLLERILSLSTKPGDLVLDPFCGCGTTIEACEILGRRWIGIDIAAKAVRTTEERFEKQGWAAPDVRWYPPDIDAARTLAARPSGGQKFETWVLRKIRAVRRRKHDRGIDGESFFRDTDGRMTHVLVSVKSGKLNPAMVRDLRGTMERERVPIGALVTLNEPSKEMRHEATHAGFLTVGGEQVPRLQFLTVEQIFKGERIRAPGVNVTDMQPAALPTAATLSEEQLSLRLDPAKPPSKVKKARVAAAKPKEAAPESKPASSRPKRHSSR